MRLFRRRAGPPAAYLAACPVRRPVPLALLATAMFAAGCASPGPPRAPSLHLPEPVTDLSARRVGDLVELHFTAPWRSTDKLPLRAATINGVLCRAVGRQPCAVVAGASAPTAVATAGPQGRRNLVTWRDALPPELVSGPRRLLSYRVEFFNQKGRSAGESDAAYTAAGPAPPRVENPRAEGSRLGIVLSWQRAPQADGTVLLQRENLAEGEASAGRPRSQPAHATRPATANPGNSAAAPPIWLDTNTASTTASSASPVAETLDTTAEPDVAYRYTAVRRLVVTLGGRSLELRSAASAPVEFTLRTIYPPPAPTGLTAAGYFTAAGAQPASPTFAVDLIWQPVDGAGLIAPLAGYNVYRESLSASQAGRENEGTAPNGNRERLNSSPVTLPAFRDSTANPADSYRYFVTAVDAKGNESSAATAVLPISSTVPPPP